jgi:hypothetical protein
VVLRQVPLPRRQHPGGARSGRVPAVGLGRGAGLGARHHRGPRPRPAALYAAVAAGLAALADAGYDGVSPAIHIPVKQRRYHPPLRINARTRNMLLRSVRCRGERGFALLKGRWRTLKRSVASTSIGGNPFHRRFRKHRRCSLTYASSCHTPDHTGVPPAPAPSAVLYAHPATARRCAVMTARRCRMSRPGWAIPVSVGTLIDNRP